MRASLIANLRDHFAEFLNQSSLKRLSLLDPTTCVGLRYGLQVLNLEAFLGSMESITSNVKLRHHVSALKRKRICLFPKPTHLHQHIQQLADLSFCVPPSHTLAGTGILTCFPSTTPCGLALGTD